MCEAGRIRHHLKHNLWRPECTILFVGYQAVGTLGRMLVEGAKEVKLFGEPIEIRADITKLVGMSGHADKNGLLNWVKGFEKKPDKVFVVHGEDSVCKLFTECLKVRRADTRGGACCHQEEGTRHLRRLCKAFGKRAEAYRSDSQERGRRKQRSGTVCGSDQFAL